MSVYQESFSKILSSSSSENRDSIDTTSVEASCREEEFYEEIEAPKFIDFTSPDHFRPDDRFWFCQRVGCDQKHEEDMDSETIYKNFVLRVMAARSPNVKLRRLLDRNGGSKTPIKCPRSAPPKSSKPRLSRIALLSSTSGKMADDRKRVVRPLLKPASTLVMKEKPVAAKYLTTPGNKKCPPNKNPFRSVQNPKTTTIEGPKSQTVAKTLVFHSPKKAIKVKASLELRTPITKLVTKAKPVAAKYLTTPRNKKCPPNENPFRSVQNPKTTTIEGPKGRTVSKTLPFHSPKKAIKVKASLELRTPITKLCEGMSELEISSQRKSVLGYSSKLSKNLNGNASRRHLSCQKLKSRPEEETHVKSEAKSARSSNSANKRKLMKKDASKKLGIDHVVCSVTKEGGKDIKQELLTKEIFEESELQESTQEDALEHNGKCLNLEQSDNSTSEVTKTEENDENLKFASKGGENSTDQPNENNLSEGERRGHGFVNIDDKENATASDGNRMHNDNQRQNGRKIFGVHDKGGEVKKIVRPSDKHVKEGLISSGPVMKFKKPKPTNPKPFRLRTDERGILKEAKLEERSNQLAPENESANSSTPGRKLQTKRLNDPQKKERSSNAVCSLKSEFHTHEQLKSRSSPARSNSNQRSEKITKIKSPLQKLPVQPQGIVKTKKELISFLIRGQKLDVIHEVSPEVSELKKAKTPTDKNVTSTNDSKSSSCGRRPVRVVVDHSSTHVPKSCSIRYSNR